MNIVSITLLLHTRDATSHHNTVLAVFILDALVEGGKRGGGGSNYHHSTVSLPASFSTADPVLLPLHLLGYTCVILSRGTKRGTHV